MTQPQPTQKGGNNMKHDETIHSAIRNLADEEIAAIIHSEMTQEDIEEDRKMQAAIRRAPAQLRKAWKLANDALGMMPLRSIGTPLNEKISEICWALSDWAVEMDERRMETAKACETKEGMAKFHLWEDMLRKQRIKNGLEKELGREATEEEVDKEMGK